MNPNLCASVIIVLNINKNHVRLRTHRFYYDTHQIIISKSLSKMNSLMIFVVLPTVSLMLTYDTVQTSGRGIGKRLV